MASLNKVLLMGNLTRDPELRHTPKGTAVADLSIAVNDRMPDGNGGWKDKVTFVDFTAWGSTAENAHKYLAKGRPILVEGRLELDTWDDKETGKKRSKLKVVAESVQFLPSGKPKEQPAMAGAGAAGSPHPAGEPFTPDEDDDDIPF
jgi:single-strand DNA-binding protein